MSNPDTNFLADRISIALRWLSLLGAVTVLANSDVMQSSVIITMVIAALWNVLLTSFAMFNRRIFTQQYITVAIDIFIFAAAFYFNGTINGRLNWLGIMPIFTSAIFYGKQGGIFVSIVAAILQVGLGLIDAQPLDSLLNGVTMWAIYALCAFILGHISEQVGERIRKERLPARPAIGKAEMTDQERIKALFDLTFALTSTLNYESVIEMALDLSAQALTDPLNPDDRLVSLVLLFGDQNLYVASARRLTTADLRGTVPGERGIIADAINRGDSILIKDVDQDPEVTRFVACRSCKSAFCYPLRTGLDVYGVLLFAHPDPDYFTPEQVEILNLIGNQSRIAFQNAQLYNELELEKERMMEIQDEARKKLARDLHDGPTQSIAAIAMRVNFARRLIEREPGSAADELFKIEDLARRTTKEIRHMLFTLRPLVLESQGLIAALTSMAEKMEDTYDQHVTIQADPELIDKLDSGKQAVIFYIAEEAVNNARKHAEAAHVWVRLSLAKQDVALLEIEDNGVGFNVGAIDSSYESRGSLGMVNMRERAELINGALQIDSQVGKGTRILLWVPLSEQAAERMRHG